MVTSRFQLGLIATLAVGLGFSLASSEAVGYPAGAAVSLGTNPVWSTAGTVGGSTTITVIEAPADQDVVITDLSMYCSGAAHLFLRLDDGTLVGRYRVVDNAGLVNRSLNSGILVPAGRSVQLENESSPTVFYNYSGYYAQP
jgi:hypothetical protein